MDSSHSNSGDDDPEIYCICRSSDVSRFMMLVSLGGWMQVHRLFSDLLNLIYEMIQSHVYSLFIFIVILCSTRLF